MWVSLNDEEKMVTPLELLKNMQSLKYELHSFKANNLKDMQAQHELNVVLLQNLIESNQNPAHTSNNVMGGTYKQERGKNKETSLPSPSYKS